MFTGIFRASLFASLACLGVVAGCSSEGGREDGEDGAQQATASAIQLNQDVSVGFYNKCPFPVVIGQMPTGPGTAPHDIGWAAPNGGWYEKYVGSDAQAHHAIAYYAYHQGMFPGHGNMTLAEFTFNPDPRNNGLDFYDVSNVDAFNMPMEIRPDNAWGGSCEWATCYADLLPGCRGKRIWKDGWTIACTKDGDKDNPNNPLAVDSRNACPNAYSWSKDDARGTKGCQAQDYVVTLCP